jgi:hypothetical protein
MGRRPALACLALFVVLVVAGLWFHEPWADEAQAWMLARELGWFELQWRYLRYEGSPGLWHTLLWLPAQLGLPYEASIRAIAGISAIAGVAAFLRHAPLPWWLGAPVCFSYFVAYQYAVISRSYCLLVLCLVFVCVTLRDWHGRPLRFCLALVVLSHVSIHGTILALGFGAQALLDAWDRRHHRTDWAPRAMLVAVALFCLNLAVLLAQLWPPPDLVHYLPLREGAVGLVGYVMFYGGRAFFGHFGPPVAVGLTFALVVCAYVWAVRRRVIAGAVATIGLLALGGAKYAAPWHEGALVLAWIFTVWLAWERPRPASPVVPWPVSGATVALLLLHVGYAAATYIADIRGPYAAARQVADHLGRTVKPGETVWGYDFLVIAVQPYFERAIFPNVARIVDGKAIWLWSSRNRAVYRIRTAELCAGRPEWVLTIAETINPTKPNMLAIDACGYVLESEFAGTVVIQGQAYNTVSYLLFRRMD